MSLGLDKNWSACWGRLFGLSKNFFWWRSIFFWYHWGYNLPNKMNGFRGDRASILTFGDVNRICYRSSLPTFFYRVFSHGLYLRFMHVCLQIFLCVGSLLRSVFWSSSAKAKVFRILWKLSWVCWPHLWSRCCRSGNVGRCPCLDFEERCGEYMGNRSKEVWTYLLELILFSLGNIIET